YGKTVTSVNDLVAVSTLHFAEQTHQTTAGTTPTEQVDIEWTGEHTGLAGDVRGVKED
ncbi:hypothetical protein V5O48_013589, partial [Marasmius crinis-equi]